MIDRGLAKHERVTLNSPKQVWIGTHDLASLCCFLASVRIVSQTWQHAHATLEHTSHTCVLRVCHESAPSLLFFFFFSVREKKKEHTVTYDPPELREQLQSKADAGTAPSE